MAKIETRDNAICVCAECLDGIRKLVAEFPGERFFESIVKQLEFVQPVLSSAATRMPRYDDLNFGFLGAKFVSEFDSTLSSKLASLDCYIEDNFEKA